MEHAEFIRQWCHEHGMSLRQLSKALGYSPRYLQLVLTDKLKLTNTLKEKLSQKTGVNCSQSKSAILALAIYHSQLIGVN
jgi:transcriptional regulator with XRE-family HTH domain